MKGKNSNVNVTSYNQSGGTTVSGDVHNTNELRVINPQAQNQIWVWISGIASLLFILGYFGINSNQGEPMKSKNSNVNVTSYNQSGGITAGGNVNINQPRLIKTPPEFIPFTRGSDHVLHIVLNQTNGIWDAGTKFQLSLQLSGQFKSANFVRGFPGGTWTGLVVGGDPDSGQFYYETTTAPLPNQQIVLEIISDSPLTVKGFGIAPSLTG